jgi:hypothetical protein
MIWALPGVTREFGLYSMLVRRETGKEQPGHQAGSFPDHRVYRGSTHPYYQNAYGEVKPQTPAKAENMLF